jgi:FMN-dependent NADH-azoreductase
MANLLHIKSSIFGDSGKSSQLATKFIDDWKMQNPQGEVVVRDLVADDLPHLDSFVISALTTPHDERTDDQQALVQRSDELIAEIKAADQIVMGVPMYNFAVPSQMKSYFDLLARAGVTFNYTENGPVGLIGDKPVYLIATRGGLYKENGIDFQIPFVQQFLSFIGLNSVEVIYAEGLNMADTSGSAYKEAYQQIGSIH